MRSVALMVVLGAAAASYAADDHPRLYAATAPVALAGGEGLQRMALPLAAMQASRADSYADVRIFDAAGSPLPVAWAGDPVAPPDTQRAIAVARFAWPSANQARADTATSRIEINAAGAVVRIVGAGRVAATPPSAPSRWLLDLSAAPREGERWRRLRLDWPRRDGGFSSGVRVEASDDARQWRPVAQTALLELAGDAGAPAQKEIDWPAVSGTPKYVRLTFDLPLALTRCELVVDAAAPEPALASQRFSFAAQPDAALRAWSLDLQGRVPVARIQVHAGAPNSVTALRLEQRNDDKAAWRPVASFVAWRLVREGVESVSPAQDVRASPARYWRLVADARTPLPPAPIEATLEWRAPVLVFAVRDGQGLTLAVGREKAPPVALPVATLVPGYKAGAEFELPAASAGAFTPQAPYTPGLPERMRDASAEDMRRWLLWALLCAAVAGLAVLAVRLGREVTGKR